MGNHRAERAPRRRTSATTLVSTPVTPVTGKRRAATPPRRSPLRLPSLPLVAGVAVLAVSAGGAVTASGAGVSALAPTGSSVEARASVGAAAGQALARRGEVVSRSETREAGEDTDPQLVALAEKQKAERDAKLTQMRKDAEKQAVKIKENKWVLPLDNYQITAVFGQYGLWANYHTGLDFNGNTGDPIHAIANGTVTFTGYDGAYGNKTAVVLDDGTEIWYCHQTTIYVSVGERVNGGETIGTVGATGNVTGSHLHLEVRPGGGGPVDPFQAFVEHGIVP
ncbi:M23 family metallopeptidase [Nocardioides hwasunensis]|uniref:M23 family metallopeptidase n=1 Tax=Nocardioides hwasunensis TaxID=397258 RepID=A0ABR8MHG4_9ACTN|nr:M23 family metallopeptidase [Nocardioides hwasunensis]MBD3914145.1 M23 family metallopeptidase [Nocardioides hwasunensis]